MENEIKNEVETNSKENIEATAEGTAEKTAETEEATCADTTTVVQESEAEVKKEEPVNTASTTNTKDADYKAQLERYRQIEKERQEKKEKRSKAAKKTFATVGLVAAMGASGVGGGYFGNYLYHQNHEEAPVVQTQVVYQAVERVDEQGESVGTLSISEIASLCSPSIVEITTQTVTQYWYQTYTSEGAGSGVIYTADGYIITNNHVVEGASTIGVVTNDGTYYQAELVATDATMDLAVIKIDAEGLTPVVFAQSDSAKVGDTAVAIGNPLGNLGGTVTAGIVSALDREITLENETHNLMQVSAAINPGNSGGGVFNDKGELIGIVIAKSTYTSNGVAVEGIGYAIPVSDVKSTVEDLITKGYVSGRVYMGVALVEVTDQTTARQYGYRNLGVYISSVEEGSPADQAGLQAGDYLVAMDGEQFTTVSDLKTILNKHSVGDTAELIVVRDNKTIVIEITLGEKE